MNLKLVRGGAQYANSDAFIADFRSMLWASVPKCGLTWAEIAERAGKSPSTIENFLFNDTRRPQFDTVWSLAAAMGIRFGTFEADEPVADGEINMRRYRGNSRRRKKIDGRKAQPDAYA